uniref:Uncharacterized protein n=1 Tax=Loa loa TaxID=7209 RepID=A0A1I7VZ43_LOALO
MRKGTYKDECQMMKGDKETDKQDGSRARSEERRAIWTQGSEVLLQNCPAWSIHLLGQFTLLHSLTNIYTDYTTRT